VTFSKYFSSNVVYHYQIAVHVSNNSDPTSGYYIITISAKIRNEYKDFVIERIMSKVSAGYIHTLLVTFNFPLTEIIKVSFEWKRFKKNERLQIGNKMRINYIEVNYMSHIYQKYCLQF
jgi:hypothetical protein